MCGIAGIAGADRDRVGSMLSLMRSRGPDAQRTQPFDHLGVTLGHVRLSILDLDARSHQPFRSPCGRYWLTFNGEIYNFRSLRSKLEAEGESFQTTSDTEVLLRWLIRRGQAGLESVEGMFALGLLDTRDQSLLLARDPIGEKPLYYSQARVRGEPSFVFASDLRAALQPPWVDASLNPHGLTDYLRFLYTSYPHTFYQGVRELPPGHWLRYSLPDSNIETHCYYRLEEHVEATSEATREDAAREFRDSLLNSVALRMQSDVPVGLFLSGGLDSNAILASAAVLDCEHQLTAYTVAYDEQGEADGDESHLASEAAEHFGLQHVLIPFSNNTPIEQTADRSIQLFGQPYGNATALVADAISAEAAKRSRVCLVGDGGDEVLNGYPRHRALQWAQRLSRVNGRWSKRIARLVSTFPSLGRWEVHANRVKRLTATIGMPLSESFLRWTTFLSAEEITAASGLRCESGFYEQLEEVFRRFEHSPLLAASIVDLKSFVPCKLMHCADRAGMAHSLELRCPFLAPPLIHQALTFPEAVKTAGRGVKPILRNAFAPDLPPAIRSQPKRPFNPPMRRYLRSQLGRLEDLLLGRGAVIESIVDRQFLRQKLQEFQRREQDHSTFLWAMVVLNEWLSGHRQARSPDRANAA